MKSILDRIELAGQPLSEARLGNLGTATVEAVITDMMTDRLVSELTKRARGLGDPDDIEAKWDRAGLTLVLSWHDPAGAISVRDEYFDGEGQVVEGSRLVVTIPMQSVLRRIAK